MTVTETAQLRPEAAAVVRDYLEALDRALASADADYAAEVREDVEMHLLGELGAESGAADARRATAELGDPADYSDTPAAPALPDRDEPGTGTVLGMPYDVRMPTAERVAARMWNPRDPRIFMPRVWGIGWDLNFGAIAVKLHLIEPDAEDEPFAEVPRRAFAAALAVPIAFVALILGSYLTLMSRLPDRLPVHWNVIGEPDRYADAPYAFGGLLLLAALPTAWAVVAFASRYSPLRTAAVTALASLMSGVAAAVWFLTVETAFGSDVESWMFTAGLVVALAVPLVQLTALARVGRARELRRDLGQPRG